MKILVTGATGFLGEAMVRRARDAGHDVRALIRPESPRERLNLPDEAIVHGDMARPETFGEAVRGVDAVIHCASITSSGRPDLELSRRINVEGTRGLFEAAHESGVRRWIQISSMSAHPGSTSVYGRTKFEADEFLRSVGSELRWTILQPSLIYGPDERGLVAKTCRMAAKLPVLPILGSGRERIRPVFVDDVADAVLTCIERDETAETTMMVGGADEVALDAFMGRLMAEQGLNRRRLHLPLWFCMLLAGVLERISANPPITTDNVLGVRQARRVEPSPLLASLGWRPRGIDAGLKQTFKSAPGSVGVR